ncbi:hypothetical protein KTO58_27710 [Chitinophaga pendula]|uniref:DinB family protein n=1 Tax=Chitinophaga TaxID=79328 RepID=UPI000BAEF6B9|nr:MULTISPECIES: DinB family protein [Chitinophaga]ASZ09658.1 damage-inducible protein DinB [Chitinophaga sp. MD30]UCJ07404.1 hypothetical protein KTO58_27710 [Chitinophaga pendula]
MNAFFSPLFDYNYHYNQQLTTLFATHGDTLPEKCVLLFSHILNSHQIWNARIESREPGVGVWDLHPREQLREIDQQNYEDSLRILRERRLEAIIHYRTFKGDPFSNSVQDLLFQVINHSTYHRGQIATALRVADIPPINTDYIFYKMTVI